MTISNAIRFSLVAAAVLTGTVISPKAQAADRETHTMVISYADLNLARKEGVDALRHRLVMASRDVCGGSSHDMATAADYEACRSAALEDAMHDLRQAVASVSTRSNYAVAAAGPN